MFSKTVAMTVRVRNEFADVNYTFIESTDVGLFKHWKTPSAFINEFQKIYRGMSGADRFSIEKVVIA
jgi:hypothetical protein